MLFKRHRDETPQPHTPVDEPTYPEEHDEAARLREVEDIRRAIAEDRQRLIRLQAEADLPRVARQYRRRKDD